MSSSSLEAAKEKLLEPLEKLKTISSSLASCTLQWQDLELFYNEIQSSILALESNHSQTLEHSINALFKNQFDWFVDPDPEIKQLCADMSGKGLVFYLSLQQNPNNSQSSSLASALLFAPHPTLLLLDALRNCNHLSSNVSVLLLEESIKISPFYEIVRTDVVQEARKLAMEWKSKITSSSSGERDYLGALTLLLLLAVFRLGSDFNADGELLDLVKIVIAKRYEKAYELFKMLGVEDSLIEYVEDLMKKNEHVEAVDCIYAFGLVDNFPRVFKILRKWLCHAKNETDQICGNEDLSLELRCEAIDMEIEVIRNVIKCIEDHEIECKYNSDYLGLKIQKLKWKKKHLTRNAGRSKRDSSSSEENGDAKNVKHEILVDEGSPKKVKRQRLTEETAPNNESQNPPDLNCQVEFYGKESFVSDTNPYSSSPGGQFGLNVAAEQVQVVGAHTSKAVSGLAGGLFNKKKKIVGIVGSSVPLIYHNDATNGA